MKEKNKIELSEANPTRNSSVGKLVATLLSVILIAGIVLIIWGASLLQNGQPVAFIGGFILVFFAVYLLALVAATFNKLVSYNNKVNESLALIDIHLKLRFDLIPNLVESVKGYAKHEQSLLTELTQLRSLAQSSKSEKKKIEYANNMIPKIRQITVLAENYPDLQASSLFISLMQELVIVEDKIVTARRIYDSNVSEFNTFIMSFPANIVAKMFGFKRAELFKIDAGEKLNVKVNLTK